jgi:hypothetical protein
LYERFTVPCFAEGNLTAGVATSHVPNHTLERGVAFFLESIVPFTDWIKDLLLLQYLALTMVALACQISLTQLPV